MAEKAETGAEKVPVEMVEVKTILKMNVRGVDNSFTTVVPGTILKMDRSSATNAIRRGTVAMYNPPTEEEKAAAKISGKPDKAEPARVETTKGGGKS